MTTQHLAVRFPAPFPATVAGDGGISVTKAGGVWTIAPDFAALAEIVGSAVGNPAGKQVWIYDPVIGIYNVLTLTGLAEALYKATSTTSLAIGTGAKSFTIQAGKDIGAGSHVMATSDADPTTHFMFGRVASYSGTSLTVDVTAAGGIGTRADWTIRPAGASGPQGEQGPPGTLANVVEDTTPQLGGQLDVNGFALGDGVRELLKFEETASAVNEVTVANAATGNAPALKASGDDANIDLVLAGKGTGVVKAGGNRVAAIADPNADRVLIWDDSAGDYVGATLQGPIEIAATTLRVTETFGIALSDETTALTTGNGKATMSLPFAFTVTSVYATLNTASSSGTPTVDINEVGTSILATPITIDANEKTSATAATPPVISDASIAANAEIRFDIDVSGTGAKGLKVFMTGYRT